MRIVLVLSALLMILLSCISNPDSGQYAVSPDKMPDQERMEDGKWEININREWNGNIKEIDDHYITHFTEGDYRPVSDGPTYSLTVSDKGLHMKIESANDLGERVHFPLKCLRNRRLHGMVYHITEGTFAGGQVIVWLKRPVPEAEITFFGSGVPIVFSQRGHLVKKQ